MNGKPALKIIFGKIYLHFMGKKLFAAFFSFFLLIVTVKAQEKLNNNGTNRPRLVVGIVIDQMRWDYLYRYYNLYGNGGFKRLMQDGYNYENTIIPYTPTVTAVGHTCIYTGSVPAIHGIVNNDWIDRETGKKMYCTQDKSVTSVGTFSLQGQMSPKNLLVTTIGDELRLATNFKSRVYGVALKDRGGILPAGHSANAAYWFDDSTGNWITSSYYMNALPQWVNKYNAGHKPDSLLKKDWNMLYPLSGYDQSTGDDKIYEKTLDHEKTRTFPHVFTTVPAGNYFRLRQSPFGNTFSFDFASQLIENEKLGSNGQTDMLCVSISSTDYIGHKFGPNSLEMEDVFLRLDKDIEKFLNYLDKTIGKNEYLLFLSADHGAAQVPDFMKENKMPGGHLEKYELLKELNSVCEKKYHAANIVRGIYEYQVYFENRKIDSLNLDIDDVKRTIVNYLKWKPEVMDAFDYAAYDKLVMPSELKEKFAKGYFYKRSGDIQFILKPQYTDVLSTGTEHGAWYNYDSHIPLIWFGWKIKAGKTNREVYMTDIAPTIAAKLQIQMPNGSIGKVLEEVGE
jgi:predicted AlkP superfamily pyrophosphatase or phosphodiesterase